jgi:hypothetical protein
MEDTGERERRTEKANCPGTKFGGYVTSIKLVLMGLSVEV